MELLQYLDMEQGWLNTLGEKVQATDNLPESTEAVNEALEVQIETHTQTLNSNTDWINQLETCYVSSVKSLNIFKTRLRFCKKVCFLRSK